MDGSTRRRLLPAAIALTAIGLFSSLPSYGIAGCIARAAASASPAPVESESPTYSMGNEIDTIDRGVTAYYFFRGNYNGSAKAKYELRYDRNLWNPCAQLQVRLPVITRYPVAGNPFSGFGNAELRYSYNVTAPSFDHSLELAAAFPTQTNGVESIDTQLKAFYITKWKWNGGSIAYVNEYAQSVIRPPGARYSSYYEGKLTLPNYAFVDSLALKGLRISALYDFRVLFNDGGIVQPAIGGIINGNINDVALNVIDTWGVGEHGLWKYKVEATAVGRF